MNIPKELADWLAQEPDRRTVGAWNQTRGWRIKWDLGDVDFRADLRRYQHRHSGFKGCEVRYVQD